MTPPVSNDDPARLRALEANATPGPWDIHTQLGLDDLESGDVAYLLAVSPDVLTRLLDRLEATQWVLAQLHLQDVHLYPEQLQMTITNECEAGCSIAAALATRGDDAPTGGDSDSSTLH